MPPPRESRCSTLRYTQVATADSSAVYSEHKVTVMNDEPVSWQVPSSISVIFSVDTKTENVMEAKCMWEESAAEQREENSVMQPLKALFRMLFERPYTDAT